MADNEMKRALITGITGQDGAYLTEFLLANNYEVYGTYRRTASVNFWRLQELSVMGHQNLTLIELDLLDQSNIIRVVDKIRPHEIYNLAAQSFVGVSFEQPIATSQITGLGALHMLEAIRIVDTSIKFYQASTSEMFGLVQESPQTETTPFYPRSPYGIAKLYAHWMTINYRESYDLFAASGILFNHESPLRGLEFVTRKVTDGVAKIRLGQLEHITLGNLDAQRDWGYAREYAQGMYLMLQAREPDTFVLSTNKTSSVREFVKLAFEAADIEIQFQGSGDSETAIDVESGRPVVRVSSEFYRPAEVELLIGDSSKAESVLGWKAATSLKDLSSMMVEEDIRRNGRGFSF